MPKFGAHKITAQMKRKKYQAEGSEEEITSEYNL